MRVVENVPGLPADELVVDRLRRQVHEARSRRCSRRAGCTSTRSRRRASSRRRRTASGEVLPLDVVVGRRPSARSCRAGTSRRPGRAGRPGSQRRRALRRRSRAGASKASAAASRAEGCRAGSRRRRRAPSEGAAIVLRGGPRSFARESICAVALVELAEPLVGCPSRSCSALCWVERSRPSRPSRRRSTFVSSSAKRRSIASRLRRASARSHRRGRAAAGPATGRARHRRRAGREESQGAS